MGLGSPKARRNTTRVREVYLTEEERPGHHDAAVEDRPEGGRLCGQSLGGRFQRPEKPDLPQKRCKQTLWFGIE